jgi:hypothetical protein
VPLLNGDVSVRDWEAEIDGGKGSQRAIEYVSAPSLLLRLPHDDHLALVVLHFEARHVLKTHEEKLKIGYVFVIVLNKDKRVIGVLEVRDSHGMKCGTTPWIWPVAHAEENMMDKASTIKLKSRGESGYPCLTHRLFLKRGPIPN